TSWCSTERAHTSWPGGPTRSSTSRGTGTCRSSTKAFPAGSRRAIPPRRRLCRENRERVASCAAPPRSVSFEIMTKPDLGQLQDIARESRVQIIRMLTHAGSGHPGGSLSVIDILTVLYFSRMRYDAKHPLWEDRDRFVLSKGHCVPAQYVCMARAGYFP